MQPLELASHIVLWVVVILEGIFLLALARQIGLLHERFGLGGARIMNEGPSIGEPVPTLDIPDITNHRVALGVERSKRTFLLFISTGCSTCASLIPYLKKLARDERDNMEIALIAFGTSFEAGRKYATEHALDSTLPLIISDDLAFRYKITIAPYGILVDRSGILRAKGLVNTFSHIESLLNAEEIGVRNVQEFVERQKAIQPSEGV